MNKTASSSINHIARILKEINIIHNSMSTFNINDAAALRKSDIVQRVCTQCITTIESNKRLLADDVRQSLSNFSTIDLKRTRDISSHDYGSIDMNIVYRICKKLTDKQVLLELKQELTRLKELASMERDNNA